MPILSAAIMAHDKRAAMVEQLVGQLDRPTPVVWDRVRDRHDTGIRAIEAYGPAATHHLVLQDDVVVPGNLLAGVERALKYVPQDSPLCLYTGRVKPFPAEISRAVRQAGDSASWLRMQGIYWGPGIVVPTADIPALTEWWRGEGNIITNYDRRVSAFFALRNRDVWYPWPSLVDHRDTDSLVAGHGRRRHAYSFIGEHADAATVDWTGRVVDVPRSDKLDDARQLRAKRKQRQKVLA
ncbi:MAG: hypothetical protein Q8K63_06250 [Acidimicrobiales bacterium]|nr:hypothetical protein [Acidimicrobiales bacterium]